MWCSLNQSSSFNSSGVRGSSCVSGYTLSIPCRSIQFNIVFWSTPNKSAISCVVLSSSKYLVLSQAGSFSSSGLSIDSASDVSRIGISWRSSHFDTVDEAVLHISAISTVVNISPQYISSNHSASRSLSLELSLWASDFDRVSMSNLANLLEIVADETSHLSAISMVDSPSSKYCARSHSGSSCLSSESLMTIIA